MSSGWAALSWPAGRLGEAVVALAGHSRPAVAQDAVLYPPAPLDGQALEQWLGAIAGRLGLEAEPLAVTYSQLPTVLRGAGPAILPLSVAGEPRFLLLLTGGRRWLRVLAPDLAGHRVPVEAVRLALGHQLESRLRPEMARGLAEAGVPKARQERALHALLRQRLGATPVAAGWWLRPPPGAAVGPAVRQLALPRYLLLFVGAYLGAYLLFVGSWGVAGRGALDGRPDMGWLPGWALLLLASVPLHALALWAQAGLAVRAGAWLRQRLLYGALRLEPDEIRHQGIGQLLGRIIESEAIEHLALNGGFLGLIALAELVVAALVLSAGAGGRGHALLLLSWLPVVAALGWRYFQQRRRWTAARLALTHDLVESMVGHRTRAVQETPEQRHLAEDAALARYLALSQAMDRAGLLLTSLAPRGWLLVGLSGLAPAFLAGDNPAALAVGLGGTLLALRAQRTLTRGLANLAGAAIAWQDISQLFWAAARSEAAGDPRPARPALQQRTAHMPVLEARELTFRHPIRAEPILRGCSLRVGPADRILLEGPSGSGKSTLAALLAGLRRPLSGLLLLDGLDRGTLGAVTWRRRVAMAPQFHENHVLAATLAFNLLMGRGWPPRPEALQEAVTVCQELGLGELLARMPAGLSQVVGETGWQLSPGERSRLYVARALLQGADVIILDESFASLDPDNMRCVLSCVRRRARALLVIAHP